MLRSTLVLLLASTGFYPPPLVGQELPASILTANPPIQTGQLPERRSLMGMAEQALAAGLAATAATYYGQLLADPKLGAAEREQAGLGLTAALLERTRTPEAKVALSFLPTSARKSLREGMLALLENESGVARAKANALEITALPAHEVAWGHALRWMTAVSESDNLTANVSLEAIARTSISEEQRQRIEILGYRASIIAGRVEPRTLIALRELAAAARGSPLAFAYARNLALALAHLNDRPGAAQALAAAGDLPPARKAEADLLAGLILGPETRAGRDSLEKAAKNQANPAVRLTALRALVSAADPRSNESPKSLAVDTTAVANEVNNFLTARTDGQFSFVCPRDPKVLDAIHLARAQLMLFAGNRKLAREAAEDLLKDVPASPLAREAVRTLALAAWGDGAYRLAANHLTTLAEDAPASEGTTLRMAAADCLFLAKDYGLAEKAYGVIQAATAGTRFADDAFHQRILCLLEADDELSTWNRAAETIENASRSQQVRTATVLWGATWNLVEDMRTAHRAAEAARMLSRLGPVITTVSVEFSLRFDWQRALLAIADGQPAQALVFADKISQRLEKLPAESTEQLRNAAPELKAQAALLKARTSLSSGSTKGIEELVTLRKNFGKVPAAAASYLVEGRHLASLGRPAEAQARFLSLANDFQDQPALAEFAALGLYEAAEQAAAQAQRAGEDKMKEAIECLERFTAQYPQHVLIFRVSLRRAEMLRTLGEFEKSRKVLQDLLDARPNDPDRPLAKMALADSTFGIAEHRRDAGGKINLKEITKAADDYLKLAATASASDELQLEAWYKAALALEQRSLSEIPAEAVRTRQEARGILTLSLGHLRKAGPLDPKVSPTTLQYSADGRLWLARSILLTAELSERDGDRAEAMAAYQIIIDANRGATGSQARLPGQASAESKLATLRQASSNPPKSP